MDDSGLDLLLLKRQLVWDMVDHDDLARPEVQKQFGLSPASREVMDAEHRASLLRLAQVLPIYERIYQLSALAGLVAKPLMLELLDDFLDDGEKDARLGALLTIGCAAVIADLLDKGLVVGTYQEH